MSQEWWIAVAGIVGALGGAWWSERNQDRRWRRESERELWAELVQLMEIYEDESKPEMTRKLAWARLNKLDLPHAFRLAEAYHRAGPPQPLPMEAFELDFHGHRSQGLRSSASVWRELKDGLGTAVVGAIIAAIVATASALF